MDSVSFGKFISVEESLKNRIPCKEWICHDSKDYEEIKKVGAGTFGSVHKGLYKKETKEQRVVALKKIKIFEEEGFPITALREILIMKKLNHKNILKLEEILYTQPKEKNKKRGNVYLVFPYMEQDLSGIRMMHGISFNLSQIKYIFYQIMNGLLYLHSNKIIHRDIKSSNILMNSKGEIVIGDYGLARKDSKETDKRYTFKVVTLYYRAPEILLGSKDYGTEIDIWSAGCVLAELLTGNILFAGGDNEKVQIEKIISICGTPTEETWPGISKLINYKLLQKTAYNNNLRECFKNKEIVDDVTFDLISKLLELNPKKRITAEEALKHDFFKFEPKMCTAEELPKFEELHEYQTEKDRREQKNKIKDLKMNLGMEIGNKDFLGKKRNDTGSKSITPMISGGKMKYS